jgi:ubiquinone/menaquinone biosynthesis C-methylase UbiE
MGCHGGFQLDEATRRKWYNPEQILQSISLKSEQVFVDVGCGEGFFSLLATKIVGAKGRVYAIDIDESGIAKLKAKAEAQGIKNITAMVGRAEDAVACTGCADIVFYGMDLHDFYDPAKVLKNGHLMLKPQGLLVDLDWKNQENPVGPPPTVTFSENTASGLMRNQGFEIQAVTSVGPYHYFITAKPKKPL